ncbi:MAG: hypothetical protein LC775_20150, partial [Acidobacteria bacterium]|nr:hypothetical protein [Acidobacteriota bacterium]
MTRHKLVVRGRRDTRAVLYVETYRGDVWITSYDCPFNAEAILEPAQADSLMELISQAAKEARQY